MLDIADLDRAVVLREVIFIREGLLEFLNSDFSADDVNTFIRLLGLNNCLVLLVYALFYINLYIFVLLCTILMLNKIFFKYHPINR